MKTIAILAFALISTLFAASRATKPYNFSSHTVAVADQVNKNMDSIYVPFNQLVDTVNKSVPRWINFSNHDSTFKWMNIDTLPSVDTLFVKNAKIGKVDSLYCEKGINATRFTGAVTGRVTGTADSSVKSGTAKNLIGGTVSGTTGIFSSTITGDSLNIKKGITANKVYIGSESNGTILQAGINLNGDSSKIFLDTLFGGQMLSGLLMFNTTNIGAMGMIYVGFNNASCHTISVDTLVCKIRFDSTSTSCLRFFVNSDSKVIMQNKTGSSGSFSGVFLTR